MSALTTPGRLRGVLGNLRAGLRMAFFLRANPSALDASPGAILALIALAALAGSGTAWLEVGVEDLWIWDGLPDALFPVALAVAAAAGLAELGGEPGRLALFLTLALSVGLPIAGLAEAAAYFWQAPDDSWAASAWPAAAPLWAALAVAAAAPRAGGTWRPRRAALRFCLALALALPWAVARWSAAQWSGAPDEEAYAEEYGALVEEAVYLQPRLLDRALAGLRAQSPGRAEVFFVGLGGDAGQPVFAREVQAVREMVEARFKAPGHSLALSNNYQTARSLPLASATSLRRALRRVGETMDREEDILFLFITSHGLPDHSVVLDFPPLQFEPLTPAGLRRMLDEAGVKWRVVVVSACYSGGFVEPLRDENTIVVTASAPDRSSFGCGDEDDWTYFGRAFFDEALRREDDVAAAFAKARQAIARREAEEGVEVESKPMIAAGPAMAAKWRAFTASLPPSARPQMLH